jgi:hypothetical protein
VPAQHIHAVERDDRISATRERIIRVQQRDLVCLKRLGPRGHMTLPLVCPYVTSCGNAVRTVCAVRGLDVMREKRIPLEDLRFPIQKGRLLMPLIRPVFPHSD